MPIRDPAAPDAFQYPTTGRMECRAMTSVNATEASANFSTQPRVEWNVGGSMMTLCSCPLRFQYPTTGRMECRLFVCRLHPSPRWDFSTQPRVEWNVGRTLRRTTPRYVDPRTPQFVAPEPFCAVNFPPPSYTNRPIFATRFLRQNRVKSRSHLHPIPTPQNHLKTPTPKKNRANESGVAHRFSKHPRTTP